MVQNTQHQSTRPNGATELQIAIEKQNFVLMVEASDFLDLICDAL
jgi:hypothetical protein